MKLPKKLFDSFCFSLLGSLVIMISGLLFLGFFTDHSSMDDGIKLSLAIVENAIVISVLIFSVSAFTLWLYAVREFYVTRRNRTLVKNFFYMIILIGFSWIVGFVVYLKTRSKLTY
jgi:hypothetical protein